VHHRHTVKPFLKLNEHTDTHKSTQVSQGQKKSSGLYGTRKDNTGRHTDNLAGCHSIRTDQHLPIFTPDALPATTLPIHHGLGQAPNMLACIPSRLVKNEQAKTEMKHKGQKLLRQYQQQIVQISNRTRLRLCQCCIVIWSADSQFYTLSSVRPADQSNYKPKKTMHHKTNAVTQTDTFKTYPKQQVSDAIKYKITTKTQHV